MSEYQNGINEYLLSKNIKDFSKYKISFKQDILHFDKWEYTVPKPTNVARVPTKYPHVEAYARVLYIEPKNSGTHYINVNGEFVEESFRSNLIVEAILRTDIYRNNNWEHIDLQRISISKSGIIVYPSPEIAKHKVVILYR